MISWRTETALSWIAVYYVIFDDNCFSTDTLLQWFTKKFEHLYKAFRNILYAVIIQNILKFRFLLKCLETCSPGTVKPSKLK